MDGLLYLASELPARVMALPYAFNWDNSPDLPGFGDHNPIQTIFSWGQGVIVIIGVIGVLFAAGKMAIGKFGRSDLAADGVGGLVWTVMGISLMLIAIPVITTVAGVVGGGS